MPVRNGARFLAEAVESVLGQSFDDLELIAVDDGSTDGTLPLLRGFAERDPRLRVIVQKPAGVVAALNAGGRAARAPYVARMDADDVAEGSRLVRQVDVLDRDAGCVLVGTAVLLIDEHGRSLRTVVPPVGHDAIATALRSANVFVHGSVMFHRRAWDLAGGYDARALHVEDYDLWCRLLTHGRFAALAEPLYRLRVHGDSVSAHHLDAQLEATYAVRARYFGTAPPRWDHRRTARAHGHVVYAQRFVAAGDVRAAVRHLAAGWRAKPWSGAVLRAALGAVRDRTLPA
jgi:glycosyltransferase involved in cell wall biosynthesis